MTRDEAPHDLIAEYLDRLRRGLRVRAGEAGLFPAVAVSVFGAITLALGAFELRTQSGISGHVLPVFAVCLPVTLGYAVRLGRVLLRQR